MKRNYHEIPVGHDIFVIDVRYTELKRIGSGSYGTVVSAKDTLQNDKPVAIKKIKNVFGPEHDNTVSINNLITAKRILREIKLLRHFDTHDNIITILDMMAYPHDSPRGIEDVYIVTNLFESDLEQIVNSPQPLSEEHNQYFLYQILRGLKYVHSADVVHRDLKPSNILLNANCDLALCDFGLSRGGVPSSSSSSSDDGKYDDDGVAEDGMTEYVVTRWYRAPELLCHVNSYGKSVDVWSVGCIFAEMLCRNALFQGRSPHHQLEIIIGVLGGGVGGVFDARAHPVAKEVMNRARRLSATSTSTPGLRSLLPPDINRDAYDLLEKMLRVDPDDRITVEGALEHSYLRELHCGAAKEPACVSPFDTTFENSTTMKPVDEKARIRDELRRLMYREVLELQCYREPRPCSYPADSLDNVV
mmetsp:Transcript_12778/g.16159  ORF Transcript_12778/g.16159 Transcript_12778/m.16159 type:complete len:417 (-) Transcript_12778:152-1402(-)